MMLILLFCAIYFFASVQHSGKSKLPNFTKTHFCLRSKSGREQLCPFQQHISMVGKKYSTFTEWTKEKGLISEID